MEFECGFLALGRPEDVIQRFTSFKRKIRSMPARPSKGPTRLASEPKIDRRLRPQAHRLEGSHEYCRTVPGRVAMGFSFRVTADPETDAAAPTSIVLITSKAELGGVIAESAKTVGAAVASVLIKEFAGNLAEEFARKDTSEACGGAQALLTRQVIWKNHQAKLS